MAAAGSVLVTGAGGFIGSHLAEQCVERGSRVRALVRYNARNDWGWLEHSTYASEMEVVVGDVRDYSTVAEAVRGVDTVFHLAALIGIPYSYMSPVSYIRVNIEGTYNVLEATRAAGTPNVLVTSTSEVYGTALYVPIDERHPLQAQSPYAATKIAADHLALSYFRSFGLQVKVVRPFNTYGPRQSVRALIPTVIAQTLAGRRKIALGNVHPTRDFTYVLDTVNAFLEIDAADTLVGQVTNIGTNSETSVQSLVQVIGRLLEVDLNISFDASRQRPDASEVERLVCDNSKVIQQTGWRPRTSLEAGLAETIAWFRRHIDLHKHDIYNV